MNPEDSPYDLLIVGGGINGAGIARDAAGRGLKVALFEQDDLASHTSSKSTKLIHGGLRYLEYYEFRLVREALRERDVLLTIAPHLIHPLRFVLPHMPRVRPAWMIRAGLFLYDWLGGRSSLPLSESVDLSSDAVGRPLRKIFTRGFTYWDAAVDDARLVILNALDAAERGAQICTRTRLLSARREGDIWHARVQPEGQEPHSVWARALVNAAGPWVENVHRLASQDPEHAGLRLVKGSHIVIRKLFDGDQAYILQNVDKRVLFAIPYQRDFTLIGTTDVAFEKGPADATISDQEIRYLCEGINSFFAHSIGPEDVIWSYSGVRPLYDDKASEASAVTRDYVLELDGGSVGPPLLSVYGGKITTYRRLAEHALEKLLPHLGPRHIGATGAPWTGTQPLPGGETDFPAILEQIEQRYFFLDPAMAGRLAKAYGTRASAVLGEAKSLQDLGQHFGGGLTEAEARYLIEKEWARTVDDVLWRRSKLGLHMTKAEQAAFGDWFVKRMGREAE